MPVNPYEILDPAFAALIDPVAFLEVLHTENRWAEGPVYFADLRCLLWSDIPNRRMLRWDEASGQVSLFRAATGYANGNTRDRQGRLVTCEQGARRVIRTEWNGETTVLADRHDGRRLNSPNDVVVRRDGGIWFTDPNYGIISDYVGDKAGQEQAGCYVFRLGTLNARTWRGAAGSVRKPESATYSVRSSGEKASRDDGGLDGGGVFADITPGIPDGLRCDAAGNVWVGTGDGVQCFAADGKLLGKVRTPEAAANLCFGGPKGNRLFITATTTVYAVFLNVKGQPPV
jgi:gluconolactonase